MDIIAEISFHCFQIKLPEDYKLWLQTMGAEFPERFKRLFAGPMWSGMNKEDVGKPDKVLQLFLRLLKTYSFVSHDFPDLNTQNLKLKMDITILKL